MTWSTEKQVENDHFTKALKKKKREIFSLGCVFDRRGRGVERKGENPPSAVITRGWTGQPALRKQKSKVDTGGQVGEQKGMKAALTSFSGEEVR